MRLAGLFTLVFFFTVTPGCVTTSTTARTWGEPAPPPPEWVRPGHVEWIREVIHREDGNPVGGAAVGAVVGAILGGGRASGAIVGAAVGAAASQGSAETRNYEVAVRFDDGALQVYVYPNYSPFRPGEPVMLTPRGLYRR
jgi:outer membrane lipoprotein SlyB